MSNSAEVPELDIFLAQGCKWEMTMEFEEDDQPKDLTGHTQALEIWTMGPGKQLVRLTIGSGLTLTAAAGRIDAVITPTQSGAFRIREGVWELLDKVGSDDVSKLLKGRVFVDPTFAASP